MRRNAILHTWVGDANTNRERVWVLEFAPYANPPGAIIEHVSGAVRLVDLIDITLITATEKGGGENIGTKGNEEEVWL